MANWLNQLQSLLGQSSSSASSSADQGLGKLLVPGALGGLAGLLVANKSARKLLYEIWHQRVTGWRRSGRGYGAVE